MSSFLVSNKTLNWIVAGIKDSHDNYIIHTADGNDALLFRKLLKMNQDALVARYGAEDPAGKSFVFHSVSPPTDIQLLKSLRCFLYQCSEGDIPNRKLFKEIGEFSMMLALTISYDIPEYEEAEWG